ncbi:MAG TPA: Hsp20/alpha crystallin family protein [Myxococcota bacterium]|nr:Hsp20/alpha crystallin family protein [Myxococcota bacterium]
MDTNSIDGVRSWVIPAVDVLERDGDHRLLVDLPGVAPEGLRLRVNAGVLELAAQRADQPERGFRRQFRLPDAIDVDAVDAELRDGVLTLTLPQAAAHRPRAIEVRSA